MTYRTIQTWGLFSQISLFLSRRFTFPLSFTFDQSGQLLVGIPSVYGGITLPGNGGPETQILTDPVPEFPQKVLEGMLARFSKFASHLSMFPGLTVRYQRTQINGLTGVQFRVWLESPEGDDPPEFPVKQGVLGE